MDKGDLDKYISLLNEKGVNLPCCRCSGKSFSVVCHSYIEIDKRGTRIPTIVVGCNKCGAINQHGTGAFS